MISAIDDAFAQIDLWNSTNSTANYTEHAEVFAAMDEAMAHIDMFSAIDDAMAHVDMLSAMDDAMAHVEMLSAIDDAFAQIDLWNSTNSTANYTEHAEVFAALDDAMAHVDMLSAIDDAMDFINKHEAESHSSTTLTAVTASCGALLAIGAGFVIKNKFNAVQVGDEKESLL